MMCFQKVLEEDLDKSPDKKPAMNKLIERATIKQTQDLMIYNYALGLTRHFSNKLV